MSGQVNWVWSPAHNDYYYVKYDIYNQPVYVFSKQSQSQSQNQTQPQRSTAAPTAALSPSRDSAVGSDYQEPSAPVPSTVRRLPNFIGGNPQNGWSERLDDTYIMRSGAEARRFFVVGKVFAMFYSEAAGGQANRNGNDEAYSMARFGEVVHSQIRRFIVVKVCQGFVYACGISTYSGRGTNKYGCVPSEYAVAYFSGTDTTYCYLDGEYQNGMIKDPIEVIPVDYDLRMKPESRIRFSKTFPIEMNIKVKDIGRVHPEHISKLLEYWNEYNNQG